MPRKVRFGYRIPIGEAYRKHVNQTYEAFLTLAKNLSPTPEATLETLIDNAYVAHLQDLHFLFQEKVLRITEGKTREGEPFLFIEICEDDDEADSIHKSAEALPTSDEVP